MNIKCLDVYQDIFFEIFKHSEICFLVMGASTPVSQSGFPLYRFLLSSFDYGTFGEVATVVYA
jgi:hypothetical protein